jgi:hypothetical protein
MGGGNGRTSKTLGTNHPGGVAINFFIKEKEANKSVSLHIFDSNNSLIKTFSTKPNKKNREEKLRLENGNNIFYWNMMYPGAEKVKGMILWWASLDGPMALPGNYKVTLTMGDISKSQNFTILKNPVSETTLADATAQFNFINEINTKVTEIHKALKNVKKVRAQVKSLEKSIQGEEKHEELINYANDLLEEMTSIEETLYQTKSKSNQDPLNFPIRLNNKLAHLNSLTRIGSYAPTQQAIDFKNEINKEIDQELAKLYDLFNNKVKVLNQKVKDSQIDLIQLD